MAKSISRPKKVLLEDLEILIVDDDRVIHFLHEKIIGACRPGFKVSAHETGHQALEYIRTNKGKPFLVLLDLNMPGLNGWNFLEQCQEEKLDNFFTVIVTSSINPKDRLRSFDYPQVIAYCEKPFNKEKMKAILELDELYHE